MKNQRVIHVALGVVLFGGMALLGILAAIFAGLVSGFIQTQTNLGSETFFFFVTMISIAIFVIIIIAIFRYLYLTGAVNADWVELIGKSILIGTTSLCLTVFLNYYYQKFAGHGFNAQIFFYFLVAGIPLLVAILSYEWLWSTTLRIQARVYPILDEHLKDNLRMDEDQVKDVYSERYKGDQPILAPSIRWSMAQYVIEKTDRQIEAKPPFLALEGNPELWAILKSDSVKIPKVVSGVPVEMSREDQQWVYMGKWLSTRDEMHYLMLSGLAKEPEGLLPGVWDNLKVHLDQLRASTSQAGKLEPEDHLLMAQLEGILSLKPGLDTMQPAPAVKGAGDNHFERIEQLGLVNNWLKLGSQTAFRSLMIKADTKDGLLPETWQLIQDRHEELRKKFTVYQSFSPEERETFIKIVAILEKKGKESVTPKEGK